jgi:endonuclease YncB( thermonuclease family)
VPKGIEDASDRAWRARGEAPTVPQERAPERDDEAQRSFGLCHTGGGTNCVVDGDTIWLDGQNIRIADIDAPETHEPRCAEEQALGDRATGRLHELVNSGTVTLTPIDRDADGYGRKLRIVNVDGTSVGATLVGEGLARWYAGGRRSWCA